jgi:translocation and assembly module TamB
LEAQELTAPGFRPLEIGAEWRGKFTDFDSLNLTVAAGDSRLAAEAMSQVSSNAVDIRLNSLDLFQGDQARLRLDSPTLFSLNNSGNLAVWSMSLRGFHWLGPAGDIDLDATVTWPSEGHLQLSSQTLQSDLLKDFYSNSLPLIRVDRLRAAADWTNGPVQFFIDLSASGLTNPAPFIELAIVGNQAGVQLSQLICGIGSNRLGTAEGVLPLTINPGSSLDLIQTHADAPFRVRAELNPHGLLAEELKKHTGLVLEEPRLTAELSGTWRTPQGAVQLQAQKLQLSRATSPETMPRISDLELQLVLDPQQASLTRGTALVQGQPVSLTAKMPLGLTNSVWAALRQKQPPDWRKLTAHLRVEQAKLALSPSFTLSSCPQGVLDADVQLGPGGALNGQVAVEDARTRPLPTVGPIGNIQLRARFTEQKVLLESSTARLGSGILLMSGQADISQLVSTPRARPAFNLTLQGTNLSLARQPESVVRGDLNLLIFSTNNAPPMVVGTVNLHDSYFLSDMGDLIPKAWPVPAAARLTSASTLRASVTGNWQ